MTQNELKHLAASHAINYIEDDMVVGVGTGSTVKFFIEELAKIKGRILGAVSSSEQTTAILKQYQIAVFELNSVDQVDIYIDGADEINHDLKMIKGGGGALTREKIIAAVAKKFVCIADQSKYVELLGQFPVPIEVIPMARSYVGRQLVKLGASPVLRENLITDNGNLIIDAYNLSILNPIELEQQLNAIDGVVTNGLFAKRGADLLILAKDTGEVVVLPK